MDWSKNGNGVTAGQINLISSFSDKVAEVFTCLPGQYVQFTPSPRYPSLHLQLNEPWVFSQVASAEQLCLFSSHSSTSVNSKFSCCFLPMSI